MDKKTEPSEPLVEPNQDSDRDALYFKMKTILEIAAAVGGLGAAGDILILQNNLETAVRKFHAFQAWTSFPDDRFSDLSKLENAVRRVLKVVAGQEGARAFDAPKGLPDHVISALATSYHGEELNISITEDGLVLDKAQQLIEAAIWFRDRAKSARNWLENPSEHFPGHEYPLKSSPEVWLICKALPEIYEQHFRPFGASATKKTAGPGIRFIQHCLAALEINKKPEAIKKMLNRNRTMRDIDV